MIGFIRLHEQVFCQGEVLGQVFDTSISGVSIKIYFPSVKSKEMRSAVKKGITIPLVPPTFVPDIRYNAQPINWGFLSNPSNKNSSINYLVCSVDCAPDDEEKTANILQDASVKWVEDFINFCNLAGRKVSQLCKHDTKEEAPFIMIGRKGIVQRAPIYRIEMNFTAESQYLSKNQIEEAIEYASAKKDLNFEYQLFLSASESKRNYRNKHAIFDACAAAEVCLNKVIDNYAREKEKSSADLPRHRTLGDKFKLVKQIDHNFPDIDVERIVDIRNDIAHSRKSSFTEAEAREIMAFVEIFLEHYSPELL